MSEKICAFGASVTKQKNGYVHYLSKNLNNNIVSFGYGGNHLSDAGICFINSVTKEKPNYCFIDFFSTGYVSVGNDTIEYLDTLLYKFTKAGCKLIFLFFPNINHNSRIQFYQFVQNYLKSNNICYIDINNYLKHSDDICRDGVHTTENGSKKYADIISNSFQKLKNSISFPIHLTKTKFVDIKSIDVNKIFVNTIIIEGNCTIIGFYLLVGLHSGLIKIGNKIYNTWDQYCHYNREYFHLNNINVSSQLKIEILQDDIDYSTCRRPITQKPVRKELNIIQIYYIGGNLKINS